METYFRHLFIIVALVIGLVGCAGSPYEGSSQVTAAEQQKLKAAVWRASYGWVAAFNSGSAQGAAEFYEDDALMVVKPFGEYRGKVVIQAFWEDLIAKGFADVEYIEPVLTVLSPTEARIASKWRMNAAKSVITNEYWVLQPDGSAKLREDHFEVVP